MARYTNFGKAFEQSIFFRARHPDIITGGGGDPFRMEAALGWPAFWAILVRQSYFSAGINVQHRTLGNMHAAVPNCIFGYNGASGVTTPHTTATPWYDTNFWRIGDPAFFLPPVLGTDNSTMTWPPIVMNFRTGQASGQYPMTDIGGVAICLSNTAAAATDVAFLYDFSTGPVTATSTGQTFTLSNGTAVLGEA